MSKKQSNPGAPLSRESRPKPPPGPPAKIPKFNSYWITGNGDVLREVDILNPHPKKVITQVPPFAPDKIRFHEVLGCYVFEYLGGGILCDYVTGPAGNYLENDYQLPISEGPAGLLCYISKLEL